MDLRGKSVDVARGARAVLALAALLQNFFAPTAQAAKPSDSNTVTPIKHVIVIVGENRTFDHLFATYQPVPGESVNNLLSQKIITPTGAPGLNYAKAQQYAADVTGHPTYELSPTTGKTLYGTLPAPLNGGPSDVCKDNGICNYGDARSSEDGLPPSPNPVDYYSFLTTGGLTVAASRESAVAHHIRLSPRDRFKSRTERRSPTTPTPTAPCTASIRCGSRKTAAWPISLPPTPAAALPISSLGLK